MDLTRRTVLGASLLLPGIAHGCNSHTSQSNSGEYLDIPIPDASSVRIRLFDFKPTYPGKNGGRIDMRASDGESVDKREGAYTWAFTETYDDSRVMYSASATDHAMTDMVRLCTATMQGDKATAEFEMTIAAPHASAWKLWRWTGTTLYLDGRVCGYAGFACWRSTAPLKAIRLFPDAGTFSMQYSVEAG